jgi:hypothetical protein
MSTFAPSALPRVAPPDPTKHVNYSLGMVLGVDDFTQEFAYLSGHDQRIVRDLIGYGVVAGLRVSVDVDAVRGPRVHVAPGEAVAPSGRLVCVSPEQCAYLNDWLREHRHDVEAFGSPPETLPLAVVACYRECETDDVPIPGEPCRSAAELMAPSRLAESFTLDLRLAPVAQLEEDGVRDFVAWVRSSTGRDRVWMGSLRRCAPPPTSRARHRRRRPGSSTSCSARRLQASRSRGTMPASISVRSSASGSRSCGRACAPRPAPSAAAAPAGSGSSTRTPTASRSLSSRCRSSSTGSAASCSSATRRR